MINDRWYEMYALAKKYYEYYGNLDVKQSFITKNGYEYDRDGETLGAWINNQRSFYKNRKLSSEKIFLLEKIGMIWEKRPSWNMMYNLAKIYYNYHGNLKIKYDFRTKNGYQYDPDGYHLGVWISTQRRRYQNSNKKTNRYCPLSNEQIKLLEEIGMIWNAQPSWLGMYELAKKYYEHYGNLNISANFKTLNGYEYNSAGFSLGEWLADQNRTYNNLHKNKENKKEYYDVLTDEQVCMLEEIGMIWKLRLSWEEMYALAKKYYEYYGNLEITKSFKTKNGYEFDINGVKLGLWICSQRTLLNKNKLTDKKISLLNEIDMIWDASLDYKAIWLGRYALAKKYYEHYGNLNISPNFKTLNGYEYDDTGFDLYSWISIQKVAYYNRLIPKEERKNIKWTLSDEQVYMLEAINIIWSIYKSKLYKKLLETLSQEFNFNFLNYPEVFSLSTNELIARAIFLKENGLPFVIDGKLNPLFFRKLEDKEMGLIRKH